MLLSMPSENGMKMDAWGHLWSTMSYPIALSGVSTSILKRCAHLHQINSNTSTSSPSHYESCTRQQICCQQGWYSVVSIAILRLRGLSSSLRLIGSHETLSKTSRVFFDPLFLHRIRGTQDRWSGRKSHRRLPFQRADFASFLENDRPRSYLQWQNNQSRKAREDKAGACWELTDLHHNPINCCRFCSLSTALESMGKRKVDFLCWLSWKSMRFPETTPEFFQVFNYLIVRGLHSSIFDSRFSHIVHTYRNSPVGPIRGCQPSITSSELS